MKKHQLKRVTRGLIHEKPKPFLYSFILLGKNCFSCSFKTKMTSFFIFHLTNPPPKDAKLYSLNFYHLPKFNLPREFPHEEGLLFKNEKNSGWEGSYIKINKNEKNSSH